MNGSPDYEYEGKSWVVLSKARMSSVVKAAARSSSTIPKPRHSILGMVVGEPGAIQTHSLK
jgi:hypothetical protein